MPQGKERNVSGGTPAASRRSHIFFAQAHTTGKSKDRNGCSVTLPGHRTSVTLDPYGAAALGSRTEAGCVIGCGSTAWPSGHRTSVTLQKTTIGGHDEQGNGAIAL